MRWQQIRSWLAILALLVLSVLGFQGLINEWRWAESAGQQFSAVMQSVYSLLGLVAAGALLMKQRWSRWALYAWAITMILTGATAPVVWGQGTWVAGLFAAVITGAFATAVIWLLWSLPQVKT